MNTKKMSLYVAPLLGCLVLAACGSEPLTSYTSEKSRIRGVLPNKIACTERSGQGSMMECTGGPLQIMLVGVPGQNGEQVMLTATYRDGFGGGDDEALAAFGKVAGLYDYASGDVDRCIREGEYAKQTDTLLVVCSQIATRGKDLNLRVQRQRKV